MTLFETPFNLAYRRSQMPSEILLKSLFYPIYRFIMKKKFDLVKVYLPKKALKSAQDSLLYLYGHQRNCNTDNSTGLRQEIFINEFITDQKQISSKNQLLGSLANATTPKSTIESSPPLRIKISITRNNEFKIDSDLMTSEKFYIIFYEDHSNENSTFPASSTRQETNVKQIVKAKTER